MSTFNVLMNALFAEGGNPPVEVFHQTETPQASKVNRMITNYLGHDRHIVFCAGDACDVGAVRFVLEQGSK